MANPNPQQQAGAPQPPKLDPRQYANVAVDTTEVPTEVPAQGGGFIPNLPFGKYVLRLPTNLAELSEVFMHQPEGAPSPTPRVKYRFDRDNPLTVVSANQEFHDQPFTETMTNIPRVLRSGDMRPGALYFLLQVGLGDRRQVTKLSDWWEYVNSHAGNVFGAEIGGRASCDEERVRYITVGIAGSDQTETKEDPMGTPGCGARYYTREIPRDPKTGQAVERFQCACGASLRVFNQIERFVEREKMSLGPAGSGGAGVAAGAPASAGPQAVPPPPPPPARRR